MSDTVRIEDLEIVVKTTSDKAVTAFEDLEGALSDFQGSASNVKIKSLIKQIKELQASIDKITAGATQRIKELADGVSQLSSVKQLNVNKNTANTIQSIASATNSIPADVFSKINGLSTGLTALSNIGKATGLNSFMRSLKQLPEVVSAVNVIPPDFTSRMQGLQSALKVENMGDASKMAALVNSLAKLPTITQALNSSNMDEFAEQIKRVAEAMRPLSDEASKVYVSLRWLPGIVNQVVAANGKLPSTLGNVSRLSSKYTGLGQALRLVKRGLDVALQSASEWFDKTNEHVEALNLFRVTMQDSADSAMEFAQTVQDIVGIDMTEWMQAQGSIAQVFRGFGVASRDIQMLSQNLTQLGYDIASVFNQDTELVLSRLQSAISGQVKGMREYGVDVSVAAIKQTALELGINKNVSAMSQAEKAMLRYATIMRNTTNIQGDLARTIATPANALRILKSQLDIMKRSLGKVVSIIATVAIPVFQALAQAVTFVANVIANLFGYKLEDIKYPDFSGVTLGAEEAEEALGGAAAQAKKLKDYVMGFDELNIINPQDNAGGGSGNAGGGVSFDIPDYSYDFLGGLESMTEMSDEVRDKLAKILSVATAIGTVFAGWNIKKLADGLPTVAEMFVKIKDSLGWITGITGAAMWLSSLVDIAITGIDQWNLLGSTIGAALFGLAVGGPFGAVIGAAAGLLSSFIVEAIARWDNFKTAAIETWEETKKVWKEGFEKLKQDVTRIIENLAEKWELIKTAASETWNEIATSAEVAWTDFTASIKEKIENISTFWGRVVEAASETWAETKAVWRSGFEELKKGVKDSLDNISNFFKNGLSSVKDIWQNAAQWFKDKVIKPIEKAFSNIDIDFKMPHFEWSYKSLSSGSTMYKILDALSLPTKLPKLNVSWYAQGGFPERGDIFIANEQGAEMVGSFGGKPAVANNTQIIEGVASGVAKANQEELVLLREQNELLRKMLAKPTSVKIGEREFGEAVVNSVNQRTIEFGDNGIRW